MKLDIGAAEVAAYRDICCELNITPDLAVGSSCLSAIEIGDEYHSLSDGCLNLRGVYKILLTNGDEDQLQVPIKAILIDPPTSSAVALRADWAIGCPTCFRSKLKANENLYSSDIDCSITDNLILFLVVIFDHMHSIPISVSTFNPEQNWSLSTPLAQCPCCGENDRGKRVFEACYGALWRVPAQPQKIGQGQSLHVETCCF